MGTNKRYAQHYDDRMNEKIVARTMQEHKPDSLKTIELELDEQPMTVPPKPVRVRVWVRYGPVPMRVSAEAVKWTPRVTAVQWQTPGGDVHKAWVWSSAVEVVR